MFCYKCGEAIPDGSPKCPACGADAAQRGGAQAVVPGVPEANASTPEASADMPADATQKKKLSPKLLAAIAAVVVCVVVVILIEAARARQN